MAKRFKFRISRVISWFQWQSCRSKEPSSLPSDPVPSSFTFLSPHHHNNNNTNDNNPFPPLKTKHAITNPQYFTPSVPPSTPHRSSHKRHVPSAFISFGCDFRFRPTISEDKGCRDFRWQKEDKWHVLMAPNPKVLYNHTHTHNTTRRKIYNSSATGSSPDIDNDVAVLSRAQHPLRPSVSEGRKMKPRVKNKKRTTRARISTSLADSCGLLSSENTYELRGAEEETETLVSSCQSYPTDSASEFSPSKRSHKKSKRMRRHRHSKKKVTKRRSVLSEMSTKSPARLSVFQRLMQCKVEGKVSESFAVVKRSKEPYEDFRRSMMEMILEKHIFEEKDLEELLHCFLSLNSTQHHGIIIEAFSEIWDALFSSRR